MNAAGEKRIEFCGQASRLLAAAKSADQAPEKVFLLSPADAAGSRARLLLDSASQFELAVRLRQGGAPLGELFAFMSSLYFRGKLSYARRFAAPPAGVPGVLVITTSRGLLTPDCVVSPLDLEDMTRVEVHHENEDYVAPLVRDARQLAARLDPNVQVVLLGSIATPKYVKPLLQIFGRQLLFPAAFVGIGDMSRGGLLLAGFRQGIELKYVPILGAKLNLAEKPLQNRGRRSKPS